MSKRTTNTDSLTKEKIWSLLDQNPLTDDFERQDSYFETYPIFIDYFKNLKKITYDEAVIGAHAVYGWMPTILTLHEESKKAIPDLLNDAKKGEKLKEEHLETLKNWMNNSIVGVSKLLHFINPELYPIWDSNINGILFDAKNGYKTNDIDRYIEYRTVMLDCIKDERFQKLFSKKENPFNPEPDTLIRKIEMNLFYIGKKIITST